VPTEAQMSKLGPFFVPFTTDAENHTLSTPIKAGKFCFLFQLMDVYVVEKVLHYSQKSDAQYQSLQICLEKAQELLEKINATVKENGNLQKLQDIMSKVDLESIQPVRVELYSFPHFFLIPCVLFFPLEN
jgi:hypothetical protein